MPTSLPSRVLFGAWLLVAGASLSLADEPQFDRPELVAIAWPSERVGPDAATAVAEGLSAWRPDGTPLPPEELVTLKKELRAFGSLGKPEPDRKSDEQSGRQLRAEGSVTWPKCRSSR